MKRKKYTEEEMKAHLKEHPEDAEKFRLLQKPFVRTEAKVGRNEACPCGSGKKFKKCCGNVAT